jgi:spermidine/putrescine transport system permease protein
VIYAFSFDNYLRLIGFNADCGSGATTCFDPLYVQILWRSLTLAFNTTVLVILMAYPLAYFVARAHPVRRNTFLFLVLIPLWTNFVIRVYAWMMLLRQEGVINIIIGWVAGFLHIPFTPLEMLYTPGAVLVGMVYEFLPFMILPIYTSLEKTRCMKPLQISVRIPSAPFYVSPCRFPCQVSWQAPFWYSFRSWGRSLCLTFSGVVR